MNNRVAVLGLGNIGIGVVQNLRKSGYNLSLYNRTTTVAEKHASNRDIVCLTPKEACENSSVILSFISDDSASKEVWFGKNGVFEASGEGKICIMGSTLSPNFIDIWSEKAESVGMIPIESPLTGSKNGADNGTLSLFLGGKENDIEKVQNIFDAISTKQYYIGSLGTATKFKLVYNMFSGIILTALAETLNLADLIPMKKEELLNYFLTDNGWGTAVAKGKGLRIVSNDHGNVESRLYNLYKDFAYTNMIDNFNDKESPLFEATLRVLSEAVKHNSELDLSSISNFYKHRSVIND